MNLLSVKMSFKQFLIAILTTAMMTPLGVLIGALVVTLIPPSVSEIVSALILAFASGSFIYIALVDILIVEFKTAHLKWAKFFFVLMGILFIALLTMFLDQEK